MKFIWEPKDVLGALVASPATKATNNKFIVCWSGTKKNRTVALVSLADGTRGKEHTPKTMAAYLTDGNFAPVRHSDKRMKACFGRSIDP